MNHQRMLELIDRKLEDRLSESDWIELSRMLRESAESREVYWEFVEQDSLLQEMVQESAGHDLARMTLGEPAVDQVLLVRNIDHPRRKAVVTCRWLATAGLSVMLVLSITIGLRFHGLIPAIGGAPQESVAALKSLAGDVSLVGDDQTAMKATSGQHFAPGDAVQVGEEGAAEIVLTDGSSVVLSANSLLRFAADDASQRGLHLESGGAEVEAAPQSPSQPLIITTTQARLTVLGTRFRLYATGEESRVELEEGKVRFERRSDGQSVEVAAGTFAIATTDAKSPQPLVAWPLRSEWLLRQTLLRAGSRVVFSHDGTWLATAGFPRLKVWHVATGELLHERKVDVRFECLAFTPSDKAILGVDHDGHAMFWPIGAGAARHTELRTEQGRFRRCAVSRDGCWLALSTSADSGHLPVWRVDDTGAISPLRTLPLKASSVAVSATDVGPQVIASAWDGTTVKWTAETGSELSRFRFELQLHVILLSADGRLVGGYGNQTGLLLVDTETGEQRNLWPAGSVRVNSLCFSRDGRALFAGMADGVVRAWSAEDGQPLFVLRTGDSRLTSLDVSDDGSWMATAGDDGRVTVWQSARNTP